MEAWETITHGVSPLMPTEQSSAASSAQLLPGMSGETPCVIVSHASTPQERIYRTTLGDLPEVPPLPAPALLVIGAVAATDRSPEEAEGVLVGAKGGLL